MTDDRAPSDKSTVENALRPEIDLLNQLLVALKDDADFRNSGDLVQKLRRLESMLNQRAAELEEAKHETSRLKRELGEAEDKFHHLIEQSLVGISISKQDNGFRFNYVNPKFADITGYSVHELMGLGPLDLAPEEDRPKAAEMLRQGLAGEFDTNFVTVINVLRKDGEVVIAELTGGPPIDVNGEPALIGMLSDVTDRVRAEDEVRLLNMQLREQSIRDYLTNLFNRRYLEESLEREVTRARRSGETVGLVMGDLDHFKSVNDTYGHQFGDKVLQCFGDLMSRYSRSSDIPCRYGGEEFMLVMPNISEEKARDRAELLRTMLASTHLTADGIAVPVSASFGVAVFPQHARDADALTAAVDKALYQAKQSGRNRVCVASDE